MRASGEDIGNGQIEMCATRQGVRAEVHDVGNVLCCTRVTSTIIEDGGYIEEDDVYWLPTGRAMFDPAKFYQAVEVRDVFGTATTITYDAYCLLVNAINAPLGNTIMVEKNMISSGIGR